MIKVKEMDGSGNLYKVKQGTRKQERCRNRMKKGRTAEVRL
jgi:hypothetical protein